MEPTQITKFGNSLYLDGSSYLQIPNNVVNFFGDNYEFTIDWWEYRTTDINYGGAVLSFRESITSTSNNNFSITLGWINKSYKGNYINININNDGIYEHAGNIILNEWVHRAIVKKDSHYYCFQNGSLFADITSSVNPTYNSNYALATTSSYNNCSRFQGYIDELRISNIARWTSNFTPPTSQYSKDNNTKILLHF